MVPRKKRARYRESALRIAKRAGTKIDPNNWGEIWRLLDQHGLEERPTYVYAIVDNQTKVVKFGKSVSPSHRLMILKIGNVADLKLAAFCMEQSELTERSIHQRLSEHCIGGEWFRLNENSERVIKEIRAAAGIN